MMELVRHLKITWTGYIETLYENVMLLLKSAVVTSMRNTLETVFSLHIRTESIGF